MPPNSYLPADFRVIYLPYVIERIDDGRHVVLNRHYKPLGTHSPEEVDYAPHAVWLPDLTEDVAAQLSCTGSGDTAKVYLWPHTHSPLESAEAWDAYQRRLRVLAGLKVRARN